MPNMKSLLLIIAAFINAHINHRPPVLEDHFDTIEINTVYDNGQVKLKQIIWWDRDKDADICQGWVHFHLVGEMPRKLRHRTDKKKHELVWWDGKYIRKVTCRAVMVTHTPDRDPEVENRKLVPLSLVYRHQTAVCQTIFCRGPICYCRGYGVTLD